MYKDSALSTTLKYIDYANWNYLVTNNWSVGIEDYEIVSQEINSWLYAEDEREYTAVRIHDVGLYNIKRALPLLRGEGGRFCLISPNKLIVRADEEKISQVSYYFQDKPECLLDTIYIYKIKDQYSIFEVYKECVHVGLKVHLNTKIEHPDQVIKIHNERGNKKGWLSCTNSNFK